MTLHLVLPDRAQVAQLLTARRPSSVTLVLPTDPAGDARAERIELGNLLGEARRQLEAAGSGPDAATIGGLVDDLLADDDFWRRLARSLVVFVNPDGIWTYLLPNRLTATAQVSDRFHVKPLLRALTFLQAAYVVAVSQNATRVLEVLPEGAPARVDVPDLPADAVAAVGVPSISGRQPHGRVQGSEGQKMRLGQYCRAIDTALRPLLVGRDVPLILAAPRPLDDIYRQWNTYPHLAGTTIEGNPETDSDTTLAARARDVLDDLHAAELDRLRELFDRRTGEGRSMTDVTDIARAATYGMVDTVFVDIDAGVSGSIDDASGAVTFAANDDAVNYGVLDEIARRVWLGGGRIMAVRREDVPGGGDVAAILRWAGTVG